MKLSGREKIILAVCGVLLGVYVLVWGIILPAHDRAEELDARIESARRRLQNVKAVVGREGALDSVYQVIASHIKVAASDGEETSQMVDSLEFAANAAGVHIVNIQPRPSRDKGFYKVHSVEVVWEGQWSAFIKFIYLAQAAPCYFGIDDMNAEKYSDISASLRGSLVVNQIRLTKR
ncbi:MAG: type II secretion system protein M [Candidatus Omnitrophica bacterium]|nr:type II secretion system protein M [Candidatus Omnitrophota bacterium]